MAKSKIIVAESDLTLEGMLDDEQAQTLRLQSSIDAVNRRLLQTYQTEEELKHSLVNLYNMVETLKNRFSVLMQLLNISEEELHLILVDEDEKNSSSEELFEGLMGDNSSNSQAS